jgi:hypothetical protein
VADFCHQARELTPTVRAIKLRRLAHHVPAHTIVTAHRGLVVEEVGVDVAARLEAGAVLARQLARRCW